MTPRTSTALLLVISGLGGFLYDYDIIGAALLHLNKTIQLTVSPESLLVAAGRAAVPRTPNPACFRARLRWLGFRSHPRREK